MTPVTNLSCTPFELWTGNKPDLSKLRVLGCKAFCPIPKSARAGNFGARGFRGILVNYSNSNPAYRVYDYEKNKVYDVAAPHFDEEVDPGWWRVSEPEEEELLSFPAYVPPSAVSSATISEVIDPHHEQLTQARQNLLLQPSQLQPLDQHQPMHQLLQTLTTWRRKKRTTMLYLLSLKCHSDAAPGKTEASLRFACKTCSWWPWR